MVFLVIAPANENLNVRYTIQQRYQLVTLVMSRESHVEFSILFIKPPCELSFSSNTEYLKIILSHRLKNLPS